MKKGPNMICTISAYSHIAMILAITVYSALASHAFISRCCLNEDSAGPSRLRSPLCGEGITSLSIVERKCCATFCGIGPTKLFSVVTAGEDEKGNVVGSFLHLYMAHVPANKSVHELIR